MKLLFKILLWVNLTFSTVLLADGKQELHSTTLNSLEELRWHYRILVVNIPTERHQILQNYLAQHDTAIKERDLLWFIIDKDQLLSNYNFSTSNSFKKALRKFSLPLINNALKQTAQVTLIGKDGGIKEQWESLNLLWIFGAIDTMPMRQQEMRDNNFYH